MSARARPQADPAVAPAADIPITGYDAVEYWVGNAKQAAHYYSSVFGFTLTAYAGPETGVRGAASYVLEQGDIRLVFTSGLAPDHPAVNHHRRHGDGVRDVALRVPDAREASAMATRRGTGALQQPTELADEYGRLVLAAISVFGDTVHSFVQRDDYRGPYLPGYEPVAAAADSDVGLTGIDHVVANVELGAMDRWSSFYQRILGFAQLRHFDDAISTEYTALMSKVLTGGDGRIKIPINEPAAGRKRSQIDEYLEAYAGPGVQHLALATDDIVATVRALTRRGLRFLAALGILVDRDDEGYLLQIFTEPVQDRPTLFYEIIQRRGATGFGAGNFKSLFEAIERAQQRRGNL